MAKGFFGELPEPIRVEMSKGFKPLDSKVWFRQMANGWSEREFQARVIQLAESLGWRVYHTHDSRRSQPGFPDLVLVHPVQKRVVWRELKTAKGRLRPAQKEWLESLQGAGENAAVWRPDDWTLGIIEAELRGEVIRANG